jgi:ABC-type cobalamin/Fe3+-siderophores transport system ATPase subunit
MIGFLQELNRELNVTVIIVTHLLPIVLNLASSVMLMGAHSVLHGALSEIFQEKILSELYGAPVHIGTVAGKRTLVRRAEAGSAPRHWNTGSWRGARSWKIAFLGPQLGWSGSP